MLLGVERRLHALSPGWLAILFTFSLPLERVIQRSIGFVLQQGSAAGACKALSLGPDPVYCQGVRILMAGHDVMVDLPCSGARGLMLLCLLFAALATLTRPTVTRALVGLLITLVAALVANVLRIVVLALGIVHPEYFWHISVMEAPWHEAIGFIALALGAVPIWVWALRVPAAHPGRMLESTLGRCLRRTRLAMAGEKLSVIAAGLFLLSALVIISLPANPIDVARPMPPIALPSVISGQRAIRRELSEQEQSYFIRYGGAAASAGYGSNGLLVVTTSAPLRHLHGPEECLTATAIACAI